MKSTQWSQTEVSQVSARGVENHGYVPQRSSDGHCQEHRPCIRHFTLSCCLVEREDMFYCLHIFASFTFSYVAHRFRGWLLSNQQLLKSCPCNYHSLKGYN